MLFLLPLPQMGTQLHPLLEPYIPFFKSPSERDNGPQIRRCQGKKGKWRKKILEPEMKGRLLLKHLGAYRGGVSLFFGPFPRAGVWWLRIGATGPIYAC